MNKAMAVHAWRARLLLTCSRSDGTCCAGLLELLSQPLARGRTLLHCLRDTQEHLVRPLVAVGLFSINDQDRDGNTPLHVAAGDGQTAVLRMLVMCSADPALRNRAGRDALMCAVRSKANTMVRCCVLRAAVSSATH